MRSWSQTKYDLIEFDNILHMHWYWQDQGCDRHVSICAIFNIGLTFDSYQNLVAHYLKKELIIFCGFSMGSYQYKAGRAYDLCVHWRELPKAQPKVVLWRSWESNLRPLVYKT